MVSNDRQPQHFLQNTKTEDLCAIYAGEIANTTGATWVAAAGGACFAEYGRYIGLTGSSVWRACLFNPTGKCF